MVKAAIKPFAVVLGGALVSALLGLIKLRVN